MKLKVTEKFGYGLAAVAGATNSLLAAFLTMFYTDSIGMAAGMIGTMFLISKLFDGITDLIAGHIVDHTKTKWGKARPWLLWLCVPTGLAFALIFLIPTNGSPTMQLIYAFVTYNLFSSIMYTMVGVAQSALMALMTQDGTERASLASWTMLFGLGGTVFASSVTFPFIGAMGGNTTAWRIVFAIYGLICTLCLLFGFLLTHENVKASDFPKENAEEKITFADNLKNFCQNKYFILALGVIVMMNLLLNINSGSQTYFYKYTMNDEMLMTSLNLVNMVPMVLSVMFLAGPLVRKLGKRKSVYLGSVGNILSFILRGAAGMTGNLPLLYIGTALGGLATGPLSIPINTLVADAVDYGEYLTHRRIEGTGSSVTTFAQKVSAGVASALVGWTLQLTGFVANEVQGAGANQGILFLFAWLPIVLNVLIVVLFVVFYKYDSESAVVMAELERRKKESGRAE